MKNALIADPMQRDADKAARFLAEQSFEAKDGKITRAEYRRQKNKKETVYHLTKSQIDAIKRAAIDECMKEFEGLDQKIRNDYEWQLNERVAELERDLEERRVKDLNYVLSLALKACHDVFGWKVYRGDKYQKLLAEMIRIIEDEKMPLIKIRRWVLKNLGIELKEL